MKISGTFVLSLLAMSSPASAASFQPAAQEPAVTAPCELHIWPPTDVSTYPRPARAKGGFVWSALTNGQRRAEALQAARTQIASTLDGETAAAALGPDIPSRLGLSNSRLVVHDAQLDERSLDRVKSRRADSRSPCYSELIITQVIYRASPFGKNLDSSFMLREFGSANVVAKETRGSGSATLSVFPASEGQDLDAANAELGSAFRQGFERFVAKVAQKR